MDSYYTLLGVSKKATKEEITKRYRMLLLDLHPDVCKDDNAQERFLRIEKAFEVLSDSKKREEYDLYGRVSVEATYNTSYANNNQNGYEDEVYDDDEAYEPGQQNNVHQYTTRYNPQNIYNTEHTTRYDSSKAEYTTQQTSYDSDRSEEVYTKEQNRYNTQQNNRDQAYQNENEDRENLVEEEFTDMYKEDAREEKSTSVVGYILSIPLKILKLLIFGAKSVRLGFFRRISIGLKAIIALVALYIYVPVGAVFGVISILSWFRWGKFIGLINIVTSVMLAGIIFGTLAIVGMNLFVSAIGGAFGGFLGGIFGGLF